MRLKTATQTQLLHSDRQLPYALGGVHAPLSTSVLYGQASAADLVAAFNGTKPSFTYARQGTPTTAALETKVTLLEGGSATVCFSTGMAAIAATMMSLLVAGDHVVCSKHVFGNTASLLGTLARFGVQISSVDTTSIEQVEAALTATTRMVFVETIANPGTQIPAFEAIADLCRRNNVLFVVDNTLATPILFRPKNVGASLVVNSLTKAMGGHADAMGGAVTDTGLFDWGSYPNIDPLYRKGDSAGWGLQQVRKKGLRDMGAALRPDDAHKISIGLETLELRVLQSAKTALALARWLATRPEIRAVRYPGLPNHPQHDVATPLLGGIYGAMLSFELADGLDLFKFLDALQVVILSTHLSDARTLAIPVAQTIFSEAGPEARANAGIAEGLVRLSVGLEREEDLIEDFAQALGGLQR